LRIDVLKRDYCYCFKTISILAKVKDINVKVAVLNTPGGAENFEIQERPIPVPGDNEVLIKVKAFGLNRSELMTRKGLSPNVKFPRVLGIECVGEIEYDLSGEYKKGQTVAAMMGGMGRDFDGSYGEYTVVPKSITYPFRSRLTWEQLGALPEMFQTVFGSLQLALKIKAGETFLIRGGTSSIGMLATQIAKSKNLTIIATTRKEANKEKLLKNGASYVVVDNGQLKDHIKSIFPNGVDKALELVGTGTLKDTLECVKPGGAVCMTGMLSEQWSLKDFAPMEFIPATVNLTIYDSGQIAVDAQTFQSFIKSVEVGEVNVSISKVFKLDHIIEAHKLMDSNKAVGKIVVVNP
jgi:NADPH2:quinone reductase